MPEGPSIVIMNEALKPFRKKKVIHAGGNAKINFGDLENKKITAIRPWGKHLIISFGNIHLRIHLLMFGSYSIDEQTRPDKSLRLFLECTNGTAYFFTCSVKMLEADPDDVYDWAADVMNDSFDVRKARKKLKALPDTLVCDALLDQQIFSGVGNIIKNEVLYRIRLHPETLIKNIPPRKLTQLINEARQYSFDFLEWKKAFVLKKHWLIYTKKTCKSCGGPISKEYSGKTKRRTFFCTKCQVKYR